MVAYALKVYVVPGVKPAIDSEKTPVPEPLGSFVTPPPPINGSAFVAFTAYTIPLAVTVAPPSAVTLPAKVAELLRTELAPLL
ncbi:hypothetical protein [Lutibacter sp. Hel_I_33_5]|uniref:hypothetical protein n=1 Tax=Lutibacter sp. Hel_I_33_5 TaxID=1566289 RepID=UPI0011A5BE92|nr:hypothetical protein [Lutibacter sp. Hel_I_33_5]